MGGVRPVGLDKFRQAVPLTTYADYCPELLEKREDTLPAKPSQWIHPSGKSGEYSCKWIPITEPFIQEVSHILYGLGLIASCNKWGDSSKMPYCPKIIYTVAPRPYISGALASMIDLQTPLSYYPSIAAAEGMIFEDRIKLGFEEALSNGLDYFFGLSLVLATVGDKFRESSQKVDIRPLWSGLKL